MRTRRRWQRTCGDSPATAMSAAMIDGVEWRVSPGLTPYAEALAAMEARAAAIRAGTAPELVWLLEHPPLFTAGTSADPAELFNPLGFAVFEAGRGGRYTYHGPGQRVGYLMLDLETARPRHPPLRPLPRRLDDRRAGRPRGRGAPRTGADRHLDRARRGRGEDRRDRRARETLGHAARLFDQRRARPVAFRRDRAVRHRRIWRDQPRSAWPIAPIWPLWTVRSEARFPDFLAKFGRQLRNQP